MLAREVDDERRQAWVLNKQGLALLDQGDHVHAEQLIEESWKLFRKLGDRIGTAVCFWNLGWTAMQEGRHRFAEAQSWYWQSLDLLQNQQHGHERNIIYCLEGLAALAFVEQHLDRAAHLWGATTNLRERSGLPLPPADRARYQPHLIDPRRQALNAALGQAWDEGYAFSMEQAIAYVRTTAT